MTDRPADPLREYLFSVCNRTGQESILLDSGKKVVDREKELLSIVDEAAGVDRVERALQDDVTAVENQHATKLTSWETRISQLDKEGRERLGGSDGPLPKHPWYRRVNTRANSDSLHKEVDVLLDRLHSDSIRALYDYAIEPRHPLRRYLLRKWFASLLSKCIALLALCFVFAVGANILGDIIQDMRLKYGFVLAVWAIEEFVVSPRIAATLGKRRRLALSGLVSTIARARLRLLATELDVEYFLRTSPNTTVDEPPSTRVPEGESKGSLGG